MIGWILRIQICLIFSRLVILNSTRHYEILFGKQSMLQMMFLGSSALLLAVSWFVTTRWSSKQAFQNKGLDRSFSQEWDFCIWVTHLGE